VFQVGLLWWPFEMGRLAGLARKIQSLTESTEREDASKWHRTNPS
jgi:hypothetical protein